MSIVGYCIGLGDRHLENIMINETTGEILHVDFNSLFYHASLLPVPEVVPFRLTQNLIDGLGITRELGLYRAQCIKTQEWIRNHSSLIFSVFNCLIYDPIEDFNLSKRMVNFNLFEASEHDRPMTQQTQLGKPNSSVLGKNDKQKASIDTRSKYHSKGQRQIFEHVERKISGKIGKFGQKTNNQLSVESQVDMVISEATNPANLCRMFSGWAPWV